MMNGEEEDRSHVEHRIRDTTMQSWLALNNLGEQQQKVYSCIATATGKGLSLTDREIARLLNYPDPNKVRPRRYELMKANLIFEAEKRECNVSKRLAIAWKSREVPEIIRFDEKRAVQVKYLTREEWELLRNHMEKQGYRYNGSGEWIK